ncbi:hypothetical protein B296_00019798 [Ensete ventricosum]|uniref:Peroxidase n=1 Tax=Ensete ventricosum TaxID=4639 RepID=A0A427B246_ENSVE|nr:hypothetical protein B296_00019798 [Ensete ventricosum]
MLGGPFYRVRLGRKDALTSTTGSITGNLPSPNMTVDQLISLFARRHFTVQELVVLSGAHTVGFSHCSQFASRIFGYDGGARDAHDPAMNPRFAQALQKACADYVKNPTIAAFNDVMTPGKFDNMYYQNLLQGLGLLASDQALAADPRTKPFVQLYAANQTAFFNDFSRAMEKVSVLGVKAGRKGEVRRRCDVGKGFYMKSIRDMIQGKRRRLIVGVDDIRNYSLDLARRLILSPAEYILPISDALTEVTRNVDPKYLKEGERVLVGFSGQFGSRKITPRDLISSFIGSMVCVEGIVTKCTLTCALS